MSKCLFIDPGFRAMGMVIYDSVKDSIVDCGAFISDPQDYALAKEDMGASKADAQFAEMAADYISRFTKKHKLEKVFLELPYGGQNHRSVRMLALVTGDIIGWARAKNLPLVYYSQQKNKSNATGDQHATKELMEIAVRRRWPQPFWSTLSAGEASHICDAAGLILAAIRFGDL